MLDVLDVQIDYKKIKKKVKHFSQKFKKTYTLHVKKT